MARDKYAWALPDDAPRLPHLILRFPRVLEPGLNGKDGLLREHYSKRTKRAKRLAELVFVMVRGRQRNGQQFHGALWPCKVRYTRHYASSPMDAVNCAASFKVLEDVLVRAGILPDDSPLFVTGLATAQPKVSRAQALQLGTVVEYIHDPERQGWTL